MAYIIKIFIVILVVLGASELAKKSSVLGALLVSLPLTSIIAMSFLYHDTKDITKVTAMAKDIGIFTVASLVMFGTFVVLGKYSQIGFVPSLLLSITLMLGCFAGYLKFIGQI